MPITLSPTTFDPAGQFQRRGIAGAALNAGQALATDATDGLVYPYDAGNANRRTLIGLAAATCPAAGQPVTIVTTGTVSVGAATFASSPVAYYAGGGTNAGKLVTEGELASGHAFSLAGFAASATTLQIQIVNTDLIKV